ncbi:MAG: hypothetical protein ACK4UJ_10670 [Leptonema sp. (in: bacteria)]
MNKSLYQILIVILFFNCASFQKNEFYLDSVFFSEVFYKIPKKNIDFKNILKREDKISPSEWNSYAIQFFYENEFSYAEYSFLKAITLFLISENQPEPYTLNNTIKSFLNLLFFYELTPYSDEFKNNREENLKKIIKFLEKREDLAIASIWEARKRNLKNLEYKLANSFFLLKEEHTDEFYYEYFQVLNNSNKLTTTMLNTFEKIKNPTIKFQIYEEWGYTTNIRNQYKEFIVLYEYLEKNHKEFIKSKKKDPNSSFYLENIFNQYYLNYLQNKKNKISEEIYKEILYLKEINEITYINFLNYYKQEYFFFTKEDIITKIKIKNTCLKTNPLFDTICKYQNEIKQYQIKKNIFKTHNSNDLKKVKEIIINFL